MYIYIYIYIYIYKYKYKYKYIYIYIHISASSSLIGFMYTNRTAEEVGWRVCVSGIPDAKSIKETFNKPSLRRVYLYLKLDTPGISSDKINSALW